jgi:AbrB family looped-hinge helix DNA binding protein
MIKNSKNIEKFYGTTTVGEKGQVVIPVEARQLMNLEKGEKLLVFNMGEDMLALIKFSNIEKFTYRLSKKLKSIKEIIRQSKIKINE